MGAFDGLFSGTSLDTSQNYFSGDSSSSDGSSSDGSSVDGGDVLASFSDPATINAWGGSLAGIVNAFKGTTASPTDNPKGGNRPGSTPNRSAGAQGTGLMPSSMSGWILAGLAVAAVLAGVVIVAKVK